MNIHRPPELELVTLDNERKITVTEVKGTSNVAMLVKLDNNDSHQLIRITMIALLLHDAQPITNSVKAV